MRIEPRPASQVNAVLSRTGLLAWLAAGIVLLAAPSWNVAVEEHGGVANSTPDTVPGLPPVSSAERRYVPDYALRTGDEVIFVLIGASFCLAHRTPGFAQAVEDAKVQVQRQAKAGGRQFRAVGVSLDWKTDEALEFLSAFGEFDEMSVGSNWVNGSAFRYIWNDLPGEPVVPQIVVVQRHLDTSGRAIRVTGERVVRRIRGSEDILAWSRSGAAL